MATLTHKRPRSDSDNNEIDTSTISDKRELCKIPNHSQQTKISELHLYLPLLLKNK